MLLPDAGNAANSRSNSPLPCSPPSLSLTLPFSAGQTFWGCLWLPVAGTTFAAGSGNQAVAGAACGAKAALSGAAGG